MRPLGKNRNGSIAGSPAQGRETLLIPSQQGDICLQDFLPLLPPLSLPPANSLSPSSCRFSLLHSFCFLVLASVFLCSLCPPLASTIAPWPAVQPPDVIPFPPVQTSRRIKVRELVLVWIKLFKQPMDWQTLSLYPIRCGQ